MDKYTDFTSLKAHYQQLTDDLKSKQGRDGNYDFIHLTNEFVINYISSQEKQWFINIFIVGAVFLYFLIIVSFETDFSNIINEISIADFKTIFFISTIFYCVIFVLIGKTLNNYLRTQIQHFATENYRETLILYAQVIKIRKIHQRHGPTLYKLYFIDENGNKKSAEVSFSHYYWFEKNPEVTTAYILKLPKYKKGYFYRALPSQNFKNETSFPIINCIS